MRSSVHVLGRAEIEKSGLAQRIQRLHNILRERYPFLSRVALALYDPETDLLKTFASSTEGGQTLSHYEARLSEVPTLVELRDLRRARVVDDIEVQFKAHTQHSDWLKAQHYRSSYTLPVFRGEALSAFVFFDAVEPAAFSPLVTEVLDEFADIISQLYLLRISAVQHLIGAFERDGAVRHRQHGEPRRGQVLPELEFGLDVERARQVVEHLCVVVCRRLGGLGDVGGADAVDGVRHDGCGSFACSESCCPGRLTKISTQVAESSVNGF